MRIKSILKYRLSLILEQQSQVQLPFQSTVNVTSANDNNHNIANQAKPFEEIPSISNFRMFRNRLPGGKYSKFDTTQLMLGLTADMGQIVRLKAFMGQPPNVITNNPLDFEQVFRNEGSWPIRPGFAGMQYHRSIHREEFFQGVQGILSTHGEKWLTFRTAVNPVLVQPRNVQLYLPKMAQVNQEFMERIREIRDPKTNEMPSTFNLEINRWIFESISVVALNKQLGLLTKMHDNSDANRQLQLLTDFFKYASVIEFGLPIWKYWKTSTFKKYMKTLDQLLEISSRYVNEAIERLEEERQNGVTVKADSEKSVLEKLIKIDKKIATVMAIDMLLADIDKNPEKQVKLREEILRVLPQKDSEFDEVAFKNMPYLRACIRETMRLYPVAFGNVRILANDAVLSGYNVPKGTQVTMVAIASLQDEAHYTRAKEYLPERWLRRPIKEPNGNTGCTKNLKASSPFVYLPFGYGPRTCAGRRIAEMEIEVGIARLVRNFHIEFNYPTENAFKCVFINVPNIPLKFKFTDLEQ